MVYLPCRMLKVSFVLPNPEGIFCGTSRA